MSLDRALDRVQQGRCDLRAGVMPDPLRHVCDKPATLRYTAMGGGYMLLCTEHGERHRAYCQKWNGERWEP